MKKKVEEKKQIVAIFEQSIFWEYKKHAPETLEKADNFLATFSNELKALILPEKSLEENYETICDKMGYNAHPSLAKKAKEESQFPTLKNNDYGQKYAIFLNHKIDSITMKIFAFVLQVYKINSIKFSNNNLQNEVDDLKKLLEKEDSISTLYFEWNPLTDIQIRADIFLLTARPSIQHLILRECKIGDQICKDLLKKLKEIPDGKLRSLDLYGNNLTNEIGHQISNFVEESKTLQFLGISKNQFNSEQFLNKLFNSIGEIPLSEQQYEAHKQKEKARDEAVERNKKRKKGAPEQPIPFLFEVKETAGGKFYVKNMSLKILNISSNGIKDSLAPLIRKFIENQGKHLQIFIEGNKFTKTTRETFKFYENVIS